MSNIPSWFHKKQRSWTSGALLSQPISMALTWWSVIGSSPGVAARKPYLITSLGKSGFMGRSRMWRERRTPDGRPCPSGVLRWIESSGWRRGNRKLVTFLPFHDSGFFEFGLCKKSKITTTKSLLKTQTYRAAPRTLPMHAASFPLNGSRT